MTILRQRDVDHQAAPGPGGELYAAAVRGGDRADDRRPDAAAGEPCFVERLAVRGHAERRLARGDLERARAVPDAVVDEVAEAGRAAPGRRARSSGRAGSRRARLARASTSSRSTSCSPRVSVSRRVPIICSANAVEALQPGVEGVGQLPQLVAGARGADAAGEIARAAAVLSRTGRRARPASA